MEDKDLIAYARDAREHAYAPYSRFKVGAALLGRSGKVYTGCNVENASYPAGTCAERCAVGKAVSEGEREFTDIAVIGDSEGPCAPCGICRQVLSEFNPYMRVIMTNLRGDTRVCAVSELLPGAFAKTDLRDA
ncbi:MAG: cytidine deaminase [Firmicutes bacterium]|nr:cytidine deaminase [Bacillota bacterium]HXL03729.1 cytidine deaminase [Bacillota bacterium]